MYNTLLNPRARSSIMMLERKDTDDIMVPPATKRLFDRLHGNFAEYKTKQDERFNELQRRLDEKALEAKRPIRGTDEPRFLTAAQEREAKMWNDYLRHGIETPELKALAVGSGPDGGYTVNPVLNSAIKEVERNRSDIRGIAQIVEISSGAYKSIVNPSTITSAWVGEQTSRPQTTNPQLVELTFPVHELYAMPTATQTLLDDSSTNIEAWLGGVVGDELSVQENVSFVNGNGVAKPRGFMNQNFVAAASWTWGNVGYVPTVDADGFIDPTTSASPADCLINLAFALKAGYRNRGTWVMNSKTAGEVRKFKDADGRFIWQQSLMEGQPDRLLGKPVAIAEDMDDIGADKFPIAFGDFKRAYVIVDRVGVRTLRDPFSAKPYILFYVTKRVGGGVENYDAYKVLKCASS